MKKPERVEAGQWWVDAENNGEPFRIETAEQALFNARLVEWEVYVYLGSGDHPEPSEWMIETLAEHFWTTKWVNRAWSSADIEERCGTMARVAMLLDQDDPVSHADRAALSLYRILRSLGKW